VGNDAFWLLIDGVGYDPGGDAFGWNWLSENSNTTYLWAWQKLHIVDWSTAPATISKTESSPLYFEANRPYTITAVYHETRASLDRILITSDLAFDPNDTPGGMGEDLSTCNNPVPIETFSDPFRKYSSDSTVDLISYSQPSSTSHRIEIDMPLVTEFDFYAGGGWYIRTGNPFTYANYKFVEMTMQFDRTDTYIHLWLVGSNPFGAEYALIGAQPSTSCCIYAPQAGTLRLAIPLSDLGKRAYRADAVGLGVEAQSYLINGSHTFTMTNIRLCQ
jgi:hypothetical protein